MNDIEDKLLTPFYLKVLHGNLVTQVPGREQEVILGQMSAVARTVTFEDVAYLWTRGWRASAGESIPDRFGTAWGLWSGNPYRSDDIAAYVNIVGHMTTLADAIAPTTV